MSLFLEPAKELPGKLAGASSPPVHRAWFWGFLAIFMLVGLIGGDRMPLIDRDEGWYVQVSRSMLQQGDWVVPRFRGQIFAGKPVLAFWCQAGSMALFGDTPFAARLPSTICGLLTLSLVWWAVKRSVGEKRALWTVFVLGSSALFVGVSKLALTDAELLLSIVIAEISLAAIYLGQRQLWIAATLWVSLGMALMTKGPVALAICAGTVGALFALDVGRDVLSLAAWRRSMRWWPSTRPWLAIFILPVIVLPWGLLVHSRSPGFLQIMLMTSMLGPIFLKPLESRGSMHGFYLLLIWPCFLPWCLFIPSAAITSWKHRRVPVIRFSMAAIVGPLLVIELVKQKLPHYLLPLFPPLAFLTADIISRTLRNPRTLRGPGWRWGVAVWGIVLGIVALVPWVFTFRYGGLPYRTMIALSAAMLSAVVLSIVFLYSSKDRPAFLVMGFGSLTVILIFAGIFLPAFGPLNGLRLAGSAMRSAGFNSTQSVGLVGYAEPSLTSYLGGQGLVYPEDYLVKRPAEEWPRWLVISATIWERLPQAQRDQLTAIGEFSVLSSGSARGTDSIVVVRTRTRLALAPLHSPEIALTQSASR